LQVTIFETFSKGFDTTYWGTYEEEEPFTFLQNPSISLLHTLNIVVWIFDDPVFEECEGLFLKD